MVGTGLRLPGWRAHIKLVLLVISIIISALCVVYVLSLRRVASRIPANGGAYSYLYAVLGDFQLG